MGNLYHHRHFGPATCVRFDGNFRCLDVFPLSEVKNFIVAGDSGTGSSMIRIPDYPEWVKQGMWIVRFSNPKVGYAVYYDEYFNQVMEIAK